MTDQPWSTRPWNAPESTPEPLQESVPDTEPDVSQATIQESVDEFAQSFHEDVAVDVTADAPAPPQNAADVESPATPWYASAIAASVEEPAIEAAGDEVVTEPESDDSTDPSAKAVVKEKGSKKKGKARRSRDEKSPVKAPKAKREKRVTLKVKLPKSLRNSLVREAKQRDLSVGELLASYLSDRMNP